MDYKELIDVLRTTASTRESNCYECSHCLEAATAIETLLAERDAMLRDLANYGSCCLCAHSAFNNKGIERCKLAESCDHPPKRNWQWRGPQREVK